MSEDQEECKSPSPYCNMISKFKNLYAENDMLKKISVLRTNKENFDAFFASATFPVYFTRTNNLFNIILVNSFAAQILHVAQKKIYDDVISLDKKTQLISINIKNIYGFKEDYNIAYIIDVFNECYVNSIKKYITTFSDVVTKKSIETLYNLHFADLGIFRIFNELIRFSGYTFPRYAILLFSHETSGLKYKIEKYYNGDDDNEIKQFFTSLFPQETQKTQKNYEIFRIDSTNDETFINTDDIKKPITEIENGQVSDDTLKTLRTIYVDSGSTALNTSFIYWLVYSEKIEEKILKNINTLLKVFKNAKNNNDTFYVCHGTNQKIHNGKNQLITYAFLSTTRKVEVAKKYADKKSRGQKFIYVLEVVKELPYINFKDVYDQILIPFGCTFEIIHSIDYTIDSSVYTFYICKFVKLSSLKDINLNIVIEYPINYSTIFGNNNISIIQTNKENKITQGSSNIYLIGGFYYKDIRKKNDKMKDINSNFNQVFMRIINEMIAAYVYINVYKIGAVEFKMCLMDDIIGLQSKEISYVKYSNAAQYDKLINEFFIDCILCNSDMYFHDNTVLVNERSFRIDVGGCLRYRGLGDLNLSFESLPNDHINIMQSILSIPKREREIIMKAFQDIQYEVKNISIIYTRDIQELYNVKSDICNFLHNYTTDPAKKTYLGKFWNFPLIDVIKSSSLEDNLKIKYITYILETFIIIAKRNNYYVNSRIKIINEMKHALRDTSHGGDGDIDSNDTILEHLFDDGQYNAFFVTFDDNTIKTFDDLIKSKSNPIVNCQISKGGNKIKCKRRTLKLKTKPKI